MLFDHQNNLGIDTSYVQISLIVADIWYKIPPSRFLAKMFIFVLLPRNLFMSKIQRKIILIIDPIDWYA